MCCWYDYWDIAPGPADGSDEDFLAWFLRNVQGPRRRSPGSARSTSSTSTTTRRPTSSTTRPTTRPTLGDCAARGRCGTRRTPTSRGSAMSIWFIPRMKQIIERALSGHAAAHLRVELRRRGARSTGPWRSPRSSASTAGRASTRRPTGATRDVGSPGWFAFKMHGNYDGAGDPVRRRCRAGDVVGPGAGQRLRCRRRGSGNRPADADQQGSRGDLGRRRSRASSRRRRRDASPTARTPSTAIVEGTADLSAPVALPPSSITIVEIPLA